MQCLIIIKACNVILYSQLTGIIIKPSTCLNITLCLSITQFDILHNALIQAHAGSTDTLPNAHHLPIVPTGYILEPSIQLPILKIFKAYCQNSNQTWICLVNNWFLSAIHATLQCIRTNAASLFSINFNDRGLWQPQSPNLKSSDWSFWVWYYLMHLRSTQSHTYISGKLMLLALILTKLLYYLWYVFNWHTLLILQSLNIISGCFCGQGHSTRFGKEDLTYSPGCILELASSPPVSMGTYCMGDPTNNILSILHWVLFGCGMNFLVTIQTRIVDCQWQDRGECNCTITVYNLNFVTCEVDPIISHWQHSHCK
jgi:hypothetical protein